MIFNKLNAGEELGEAAWLQQTSHRNNGGDSIKKAYIRKDSTKSGVYLTY